jgi:hypothetical protein
MTTLRHRSLKEIAADVAARLAPALKGAPVQGICASSFAQVVKAVEARTTFPCVLIIPGGGDYDGAGHWKRREERVHLLVLGQWSAQIAGADDTVWELAEACVRRFLPGSPDGDAEPDDLHSSQAVELAGVLYSPLSLRPLDVAEDRTCIDIALRAVNPMAAH